MFSIFQEMKLPLAIALLVLLGCAANKPVVSQIANTSKDSRCQVLIKFNDEHKILLRELIDGVEYRDNDEIIGKCYCISTIICNEIDYCSMEKCPWGIFSTLDSIAKGEH
jgi:hypothetical protein